MSKETFEKPALESKIPDISMEEPLKTDLPETILPDDFKKQVALENNYIQEAEKELNIPKPEISTHPDREPEEIPNKIRGNTKASTPIKKFFDGILKGALFSSLLATSAAKATPAPAETMLKNTDSTETGLKKSPEVVVDHKIELMKIANEIKEKSPNIAKVIPLEQSDSTKEVFAISLNSYKNYEDIFATMAAVEVTVSSEQTMISSLKNNPKILNTGFSFMATEEKKDKLGNPAYATLMAKRGGGELFINAREASIEMNNEAEVGYMFIVEKKKENKSTTANYANYVKN